MSTPSQPAPRTIFHNGAKQADECGRRRLLVEGSFTTTRAVAHVLHTPSTKMRFGLVISSDSPKNSTITAVWRDRHLLWAPFVGYGSGWSLKPNRRETRLLQWEDLMNVLRCFFLVLAVWAAPVHSGMLAVVDGTVIDGTGGEPVKNGVVLIEDGRIAAVGAARDVVVPESATVIDARGKYVIPGLIDANLHLFFSVADLEKLYEFEGRYHELIIEAAQIALKTGQTTVFDTWGPRGPLVKARDLINAGEAVGSRIYLAGNIIGFDGPMSADFFEQLAAAVLPSFAKEINEMWQQGTGRELMWMGPDEVRARVREYATKDVDFLKYGASGHQEMFFISFSPRVQRAIVEVGHEAGKTVQAHTTSIESLDMAIEAGLDIVTHCDISGPDTPIPAETIQKMVDRDIACSVLPITQARLDALLEKMPDSVMTPFMKTGGENVRNMIAAGVTLLLSTDAGIMSKELEVMFAAQTGGSVDVDPSTTLGEGHFNALYALEEMGMAPMEILKTVTSHIAEAYELEDEIGTLEVGKMADLVVLDENPLKSAKNYRSINTVIKEGRVVDINALPINPVITVK
jgi:imidazolonepropionase-like amidohydrolase